MTSHLLNRCFRHRPFGCWGSGGRWLTNGWHTSRLNHPRGFLSECLGRLFDAGFFATFCVGWALTAAFFVAFFGDFRAGAATVLTGASGEVITQVIHPWQDRTDDGNNRFFLERV